jgi:hypothetical protein
MNSFGTLRAQQAVRQDSQLLLVLSGEGMRGKT